MTLQKIVAAILLVSMMLGAGLQVDRAALRTLGLKWQLLLRALAANFIIVPLVAIILASSFHLRDAIATGLLLMAVAPGVPFLVLSGGRQRGGSHEFAIVLSLLMPALSAITIPITARLILPAVDRPDIPASFLVSLLLYQLAPLVLGAAFAQRKSKAAQSLVRPLRYLTIVAFLALLALLIPALVRGVTTAFGTFGLLAMFLTAAISYAAGWLLGAPQSEYRRTLAVGTALRNPAVAMMIATRFADTSVAAGVAAYFFIQIVVTSLAGRLFKQPA